MRGMDSPLVLRHNDKDKLPGPPATPSCRAKPVWRPRSASSVGYAAAYLHGPSKSRTSTVHFTEDPSAQNKPRTHLSPSRPTAPERTQSLRGIHTSMNQSGQ